MGSDTPRGRTGERVLEAGTYRCESGETWTYVRGDTFRECPRTHRQTLWEKSHEPDHPGGSR